MLSGKREREKKEEEKEKRERGPYIQGQTDAWRGLQKEEGEREGGGKGERRREFTLSRVIEEERGDRLNRDSWD